MTTATTQGSTEYLDVPSRPCCAGATSTRTGRPWRPAGSPWARQDAEDRLAELLAQVGRTDLHDVPAWAHLARPRTQPWPC